MVSSSRSSSAGSSRSNKSTVTVNSEDLALPKTRAVEALIYLSGGRPSRHRNLRKCRVITEWEDDGGYSRGSGGSTVSITRRKEVVQWFFVGDSYEPWLVEVDDDDGRSTSSRSTKKSHKSSRGGRDKRPPPPNAAARDPVWGNQPQHHHNQQHHGGGGGGFNGHHGPPPPPHHPHHMHMEDEIIEDDDDSDDSSYMSDNEYGYNMAPPPPMGPPMGMGMPPMMNHGPPMNHMGGVPPMPHPARSPTPNNGGGGDMPEFFKLN